MSTKSKTPTKVSYSDRKFTPRPSKTTEERLPKLYRALTDQVEGAHFDNAIKTCKKILQLDPSSQPAFESLLFLNLQTDDYASALDLVLNPPSKSDTRLEFEKAYCLYRLHREKEALDVLDTGSTRGRKEEHLEAQIRYRLGEYERAQEIYDDLLAQCSSSSPEHSDILTNLSATTGHRDFDSHGHHAHLSAPVPGAAESRVPNEAELESHVPSLPTGWAVGGVEGVKKAAPAKTASKEKSADKKGKPRHKLPKGAVVGKAFTEDPDRWLPLRQRASYVAAMSKKKGANLSMGTGMTQGSTTSAAAQAGGGGGGAKSKKGKKK